jgi:hypothetical protein
MRVVADRESLHTELIPGIDQAFTFIMGLEVFLKIAVNDKNAPLKILF